MAHVYGSTQHHISCEDNLYFLRLSVFCDPQGISLVTYTLPYFTLREEKKAKYIWKTYCWIATRERARSSSPPYCESLSVFLTLSQVLLLFPPTFRLAVRSPRSYK